MKKRENGSTQVDLATAAAVARLVPAFLHTISTPLNILTLFCTRLTRSAQELGPPADKLLKDLATFQETVDRLIESLVVFRRMTRGELHEFNPLSTRELLKIVQQNLADRLKNNSVTFSLDVSNDRPIGDRGYTFALIVTQVLSGLIDLSKSHSETTVTSNCKIEDTRLTMHFQINRPLPEPEDLFSLAQILLRPVNGRLETNSQNICLTMDLDDGH